MGGKKGTAFGRVLTKLIPEDSLFHNVAEAADQTFETLVFGEDETEVSIKDLPEVKEAVFDLKNVLLHLAKFGIIAINWLGVDGVKEEHVEDGLYDVLRVYVDKDPEQETEAQEEKTE